MLASESKERYPSAFRKYPAGGSGDSPSWLWQHRQSALASFDRLGFPTGRNEDWKYTSIEALVAQAFERGNGEAKAVSVNDVLAWSFTDFASSRLVFVNGTFAPGLSSVRDLPQGARVQSLAEALKESDHILAPHLARHARHRQEAFVALNTAFMEDGAAVFIPEGRRLEEPLYLIFVSMAGATAIATHPRNLIVLGAASEAKIVESYIGLGTGSYLTNAVTELIAEQGAVADHYRLQRETDSGIHIGALAARLSRDANFTAHAITLGGALVRNDVRVVLDGEGAGCVLNGLYLMEGKQHVDNHTEIEHAKPRGSSRELYKGILSGSARGVFNGKIVVHKDAQKTDARQTNKNLLLSENAVVNTKPQLEIRADDVKCSHGSTIGQIDSDALFYLRSRGIGFSDAQSLLSYAFASDVVGRVKIPAMRARLDDYLLIKFGRNQ